MYGKPNHTLSNVEKGMGDCAVDGRVKVYMLKNGKRKCSVASNGYGARKRATAGVPVRSKKYHTLSDIDAGTGKATCSLCGPTLVRPAGGGYWQCETVYKARLDRSVGSHGSTYGDARKTKEAVKYCENEGCKSTNTLRLDHNHTSGIVRGVLCNNCNLALGQLKDNPLIVEGLLKYLLQRDNTE